MKKLTNKQENEIKCLDYFRLKNINYHKLPKIQETGILINKGKIIGVRTGDLSAEEAYFEITTKGIKNVYTSNKGRLLQILDSKKWRLRTLDMYEQGVLEGSTPYITLLGLEEGDKKVPKYVADFLGKTMFKGNNKELIMRLWEGQDFMKILRDLAPEEKNE